MPLAGNFYIQRLSVFGMADLEGYDRCYLKDLDTRLQPRCHPAPIFRNMHELRSLDLLMYPQEDDSYSCVSHARFIEDFLDDDIADEFATSIECGSLRGCSVTLINMYPMSLADTERPVLLVANEGQDFTGLGPESREAAQRMLMVVKQQGWKVEDSGFCATSGIWPMTQEDYEAIDWQWMNNLRGDLDGRESNLERALPVGDEIVCHRDCVKCWCVKCWQDNCSCEGGPTKNPWD